MKVAAVVAGRLDLIERDTPVPEASQVLVEVAGAGLNRADLLQKMGRYSAPPGWVEDGPGLEHSGTVVATGPLVGAVKPGDRVFGIVGGGAHATHLVTTEELCTPVPEGLDLVTAAAVPEAFVTAHDALFTRARLRPGERVLIHGVGSGVGTAALQLARATGATTVGTSRTAAKLQQAAELGLDEGVVAGERMARAIGEVDVVIDLIGGSYLEVDLEVASPQARIVVVGLLAGASASINLATVLHRRLEITGTVLRSRPEHQKAAAVAAFAREVVPLLDRGVVGPVIHRVVPLRDAASAYDAMAENSSFGKILLAPEGP